MPDPEGPVEIVFDSYPGLPPFAEVEGPSAAAVDRVAAQFQLGPPGYAGAGFTYLELYGIPTARPLTDLDFASAATVMGPLISRGRPDFDARLAAQRIVVDAIGGARPAPPAKD